MTYSNEFIKNKIATDNRWLFRGVIAIWNFQTLDEKRDGETKHINGVGFNSPDAPFLNSIAKLINTKCTLSEKQVYKTRQKMMKYSKQLTRIANKEIV